MVYREVSIYRVMRKIAHNDYENIYVQDNDGSKDLLQLKRFNWKLEQYKNRKYFELEK